LSPCSRPSSTPSSNLQFSRNLDRVFKMDRFRVHLIPCLFERLYPPLQRGGNEGHVELVPRRARASQHGDSSSAEIVRTEVARVGGQRATVRTRRGQ